MVDELEYWEDEYFDKILGQFQGNLNGIMEPLTKYGQDNYVAMVIPEIVLLAYQLHIKLSGIDVPFELTPHQLHMLKD